MEVCMMMAMAMATAGGGSDFGLWNGRLARWPGCVHPLGYCHFCVLTIIYNLLPFKKMAIVVVIMFLLFLLMEC
jgi:hypothetical protein